MRSTQKSMLTFDTLYLFEKLVDINQFTDKQIKEIEHNAYYANIGAKSKKAAWEQFCQFIYEDFGIANLQNLYEGTDI